MNVTRTFDGLAALVAVAEKTPTWGHGELASRDTPRSTNWTDGVSFEQAVTMARRGWPEGAARAARLLNQFNLAATERHYIGTYNDVTGSYVDVGEYVQGTPECMVNFQEDTRKARFVHVLVSGVVACRLKAANAMNRGVTIAALVDYLETQGTRCEVSLIYLNRESTGNGASLQYTVTLKRAADPLNVDTLAFGVAHPACFRRLVFGAYEHEAVDVRTRHRIVEGGGYGKVGQIPEAPGCIVFQNPGHDDTTFETEAGALAKLQGVLATARERGTI